MLNEARDIDCHSALKQMWDYLDFELTDERMAEVRKHLVLCQHCLQHADFARRFLDALQATRGGTEMPAELRVTVLRHLAESGYSLH
ncbi:MAG: zf-HC2 domain-containing protein [Gemmatimonadaceae bacterium]